MRSMKIKLGVVVAVGSLLALTSALWATGAGAAGTGGVTGSGTASASKSVCGAGTGKQHLFNGYYGFLIGVDFTTVGKLADAYFKCVNDNGGIKGRPITYKLYSEALNPTQEASLARKIAAVSG